MDDTVKIKDANLSFFFFEYLIFYLILKHLTPFVDIRAVKPFAVEQAVFANLCCKHRRTVCVVSGGLRSVTSLQSATLSVERLHLNLQPPEPLRGQPWTIST